MADNEETGIPAVDLQTDNRRKSVADAAGLGPMHGGTTSTSRTAVRYRAECPKESGLIIEVSRIVDNSKSLDSHLPIECPICTDEHLLART